MPDLQRRDAIPLRQVQRHAGDHPAAVVPQRPLRVQLPIEARRDHAAVLQPRQGGCGQGTAQQVRQRRIGEQGGQAPRCAVQRRRGFPCPCQAQGDGGQIPRRPASGGQAAQGAGEVGHAAKGSAKGGERIRPGQQPGPAVLPPGNRGGVQQRPAQPGRQQPRARRRQGAPDCGQQGVGAAVPGARHLQAGARGGVQHHLPGVARRLRAGQARHGLDPGSPDIGQGDGGCGGLGIRKGAEGVQAGGAERLRDLARGCHGRRGRGIGAAAAGPFAQRQAFGREDLGGFQPAQQVGQGGRGGRRRLEQAGAHVQPGRAQAAADAGQGEQQVGTVGVKQAVLRQRAGRDQADDGALQGGLAGAALRGLHLLGDGDAEAAADQAGQVGVGGVDGDAAHRDWGAAMLPALGQRDVQRRCRGLRISEEQLVEIAHAQEQQRVGVLRLQAEPLGDSGGRALGAGGVHAVTIPCHAAPAKRLGYAP